VIGNDNIQPESPAFISRFILAAVERHSVQVHGLTWNGEKIVKRADPA
jgi:hypothetical protein